MNRRQFLKALPAISLALGLAAKGVSYSHSRILPLDEYAKLMGIKKWQAHVEGMKMRKGRFCRMTEEPLVMDKMKVRILRSNDGGRCWGEG